MTRLPFLLLLSSALVGSSLIGCGRSELSPQPRGPSVSGDGGVDGGQCTPGFDCDGGLACDGIACDDGIDCTVDRCDESADRCVFEVDHSRCPSGLCDPRAGGCVRRDCGSDAECSDGRFCNGEEVCVAGVCARGPSPSCAGDACAEGFCDPMRDMCVRVPLDRDGDGHTPPGCGGRDCDDSNPLVHPGAAEACGNRIDDDCDGLLDCADASCAGHPACSCGSPEACGNGFDDDCDGEVDCADSDCLGDPSCPPSCDLRPLGSAVGPRVAVGSTAGRPDVLTPSCSFSRAGERAFRWRAPASGTYTFDTFGSDYDTILYALDGCPGAPLPDACDDDTGGLRSQLTLTLMAGTEIVLVVDGFSSRTGDYVLNISLGSATERCDDFIDNDGDGAVDCADRDCFDDAACCRPRPEVCTDGADQDCDGLIDCDDPSCGGSAACCVPRPESCTNGVDDDCDLRVDCADPGCSASPACCMPSPEVCGDGADQDCDGLIDCADPDCAASPICGSCPDRDLSSRLGLVATGSTVGQGDDFTPSCAFSSNAEDLIFRWTAPFAGRFVFDTGGSGYDTMLALLGSCTGPELACDDDGGPGLASQLDRTLSAGETVFIVVDGWASRDGAFALNIILAPTTEARCADRVDNDLDGRRDCVDPDCAMSPACAP